MKRLPLALAAAIACLGLACGDLTDADTEAILEQIAQAYPIPNIGEPLSNSEDLDVQAAGVVDEAIEKERAAREHLREGLANKDPGAIEKAIDERPMDVTYHAYLIAMRLALEGRESDAYHAALHDMAWPLANPVKDRALFEFHMHGYLLPALLEVRGRFPSGSDAWNRVQAMICPIRRSLSASAEPLAPAVLALNPDDTPCP